MKWKDLSKKEKIKKISKYVVNGLNFINLLLVGLADVWGWQIDNISKTIIVITGGISIYLVGGKLFSLDDDIEKLEENDE